MGSSFFVLFEKQLYDDQKFMLCANEYMYKTKNGFLRADYLKKHIL